MDEVSLEQARPNFIPPMIDFSRITLDQLAGLKDSALISSLNRILGDIDNPDDVVFAGFNASI